MLRVTQYRRIYFPDIELAYTVSYSGHISGDDRIGQQLITTKDNCGRLSCVYVHQANCKFTKENSTDGRLPKCQLCTWPDCHVISMARQEVSSRMGPVSGQTEVKLCTTFWGCLVWSVRNFSTNSGNVWAATSFRSEYPSEYHALKTVHLQVESKNKWQNFNKYNLSTRMQSLITANLHICKSSWIWWPLSLILTFNSFSVVAKPVYWSQNITSNIHRMMLALCIVVSKFVTK